MSDPNRKLLLIGWDAADWQVIHSLLDAGRMPTLKALIEGGVMGDLLMLNPSSRRSYGPASARKPGATARPVFPLAIFCLSSGLSLRCAA